MKAHGIDLESQAIRDFCTRWKIKELSVFGSILRDDFRPDSDVDFLADFDEDEEWDLFDEIHMQEELSQIVGRKVDIVDRHVIEHDSNRFFKTEIFSTAESEYAKV